jgi:hypothetical protein
MVFLAFEMPNYCRNNALLQAAIIGYFGDHAPTHAWQKLYQLLVGL